MTSQRDHGPYASRPATADPLTVGESAETEDARHPSGYSSVPTSPFNYEPVDYQPYIVPPFGQRLEPLETSASTRLKDSSSDASVSTMWGLPHTAQSAGEYPMTAGHQDLPARHYAELKRVAPSNACRETDRLLIIRDLAEQMLAGEAVGDVDHDYAVTTANDGKRSVSNPTSSAMEHQLSSSSEAAASWLKTIELPALTNAAKSSDGAPLSDKRCEGEHATSRARLSASAEGTPSFWDNEAVATSANNDTPQLSSTVTTSRQSCGHQQKAKLRKLLIADHANSKSSSSEAAALVSPLTHAVDSAVRPRVFSKTSDGLQATSGKSSRETSLVGRSACPERAPPNGKVVANSSNEAPLQSSTVGTSAHCCDGRNKAKPLKRPITTAPNFKNSSSEAEALVAQHSYAEESSVRARVFSETFEGEQAISGKCPPKTSQVRRSTSPAETPPKREAVAESANEGPLQSSTAVTLNQSCGRRQKAKPRKSPAADDPNFKGAVVRMKLQIVDGEPQLKMEHYFNYKQRRRFGPRDIFEASDSEDDFAAAGRARKQCSSCTTKSTPLWRPAEDGTMLCNACGIRYKKYKVRCSRCWHVPTKKKSKHICCLECGGLLRIAGRNSLP